MHHFVLGCILFSSLASRIIDGRELDLSCKLFMTKMLLTIQNGTLCFNHLFITFSA